MEKLQKTDNQPTILLFLKKKYSQPTMLLACKLSVSNNVLPTFPHVYIQEKGNVGCHSY